MICFTGSQEFQDHHLLLRGLLELVSSTASLALLEHLYLVLREGEQHVLAIEVCVCAGGKMRGEADVDVVSPLLYKLHRALGASQLFVVCA